jgi:yecA family protein
MRSKRDRAPKDEARLKAFLGRSTHPEGTLSLGELRGFLFALNAAPELVKPSEWIRFIFSDEEPEFRNMEEAEEVMGSLMHLYNDINKIVRAKGSRLPPGCVFLEPPMANLEPEAPVSQWARGFAAGQHHVLVKDGLSRVGLELHVVEDIPAAAVWAEIHRPKLMVLDTVDQGEPPLHLLSEAYGAFLELSRTLSVIVLVPPDDRAMEKVLLEHQFTDYLRAPVVSEWVGFLADQVLRRAEVLGRAGGF